MSYLLDWRQLIRKMSGWLQRENPTHYRWLFIGSLAMLGMSVGVGGTILAMRWQADRAARIDALIVLKQAAQQLSQTLQSRREALTALRDALDSIRGLSDAEQMALAKSAGGRLPSVMGVGWIQKRGTIVWWIPPTSSNPQGVAQINREARTRTPLRNFAGLPAAFTVWQDGGAPVFVMLEPLRAHANRSKKLIALFDARSLASDALTRALPSSRPARIVEGNRLLVRLGRWPRSQQGTSQPLLQQAVKFEGASWLIQMPPQTPPAAASFAWLNALLTVVAMLAGFATLGMVWATEQLRALATTDELTGLFNRRYFLEQWDREVERGKRYKRDVCCLMIDVNGFKRINDVLGHHMGDCVLKQVAQELKTYLRQSDLLARFGGDEFIVALPETNLDQALAVAEKLRTLAIRGSWTHYQELGPLRLSVGVSHLQPNETPHQAIQDADANLYALREAAHGKPEALHTVSSPL